jgi:PAS domain S-box-containing protein
VRALPRLSAGEWRDFADSLDLPGRYPAIQGLGVIYAVRDEDLAAFQRGQRAAGPASFTIHPLPGRTLRGPDHAIVTYIEPQTANWRAVGLDSYSEPLRRKALAAARDSGTPQLSRRIILERSGPTQPGSLFFAPIYRRGAHPTNVDQRRANFVGWTVAPLLFDQVLGGVLEDRTGQVRLWLFEGPDTRPENLIYASDSDGAPGSFEIATQLTIAGQTYTLGWQRGPSFPAVARAPGRWSVAIGALAAVLLAGWTGSLLRRRADLERDVRARTENLRDSEERFAKAFRVSPIGMAIRDLETGRYIDVNESCLAMTGYTRAEVLGRTPADIGWVVDTETDAYQRPATQPGAKNLELRFRHKDGRIVVGAYSSEVIRVGGRACLFSVTVDITARQQSEQAVQESEMRYRQLFEAGSDALLLVDCASLQVVDANAAAVRLYGWTRAELLTKSAVDLSAEPMETQAAIEAEPARLNTPIRWHRHKDGTEFPVEVAGNFFLDRGRRMHLAAIRDISDRLAVDRMVRLRGSALEAAASAILITDCNGIIEWANPAFTRLSGWSLVEAVGRTPQALVKSGLHDPAFYQRMWATIAAGQVWQGEVINRRKDGSLRTEEMTITPIRDERDRISHFIAINQDVTERQAAQAALQQEQAFFESLASTIPDRLYFKDRSSRFVRINDAMARFFGLKNPAEAVGKTDFAIFSTEHARQAYLDEQRIMATGLPLIGVEEKETWPDGTVTWVSSTKMPLRDARGAITGLVGLSRDITESKRAHEALRESEEKFSKIFQVAPVAVVITAVEDGAILEANESFLRMSGYTSEEILGRTTVEIGWVDAKARRDLVETLRAHGHIHRTQLFLMAKDGRQVDCLFNGELIEIGGRTRLLSILLDVSESHQLEAQLRQAQKMEAVGQLAGGVAHDFNNILAATMMHLSILQMEPGLTASVRGSLKELEIEAKRAASLTRQLLMFSRRQAMNVQLIDLNGVLANLLKMLRRLIGEHVELVFVGGAESAWVEVDAGMIEQVIMNLCVNSRDAMPEGGRLTISIHPVELTAAEVAGRAEARPGPFINLSFGDTGCGMDAATVKHIFEPFFTTKEPGKGTGLGLATVYGIIKQLQGWIEVASAVGQGTTFSIFLPARSAPASERQTPLPGNIPGGTETVLVVEDDASVRRMVAGTLRVLGYRVLDAANGKAAEKLWAAHADQISLLFTDVIMPEGISGLTLAERFRAAKPALRVIVSSGYSDQLLDLNRLEQADLMRLPKPYTAEELADAVRACLDRV